MSLQNPRTAALAAIALTLPFAAVFTISAMDLQPLESWLRRAVTGGAGGLNPVGLILIGGSLVLLPVALGITLRPVVRERRILGLNLAVALGVAALMTPMLHGLSQDIVRCEIQRIPNCD